MKNKEQIDLQIRSAEQELAALGEKRKQLQARIKQLKVQKQSIAEIPLPFDRLSESNVTNNSTQEKNCFFLVLVPWAGRCLSKAFRKQAHRQKRLPAGLSE